MSKVKAKVLVIHGTEDEVIDFSHGLHMNELAVDKFDPLWVNGAGHNDIEHYPQYMHRLDRLMRDLHRLLAQKEARDKQEEENLKNRKLSSSSRDSKEKD